MSECPRALISLTEGTTRPVILTCRDKFTGEDFEFAGYTVQTYLRMYGNTGEPGVYLPTTASGNTVSFTIPASESVGKRSGVLETRIFKGAEVYSVIICDVEVDSSPKPDIVPGEA